MFYSQTPDTVRAYQIAVALYPIQETGGVCMHPWCFEFVSGLILANLPIYLPRSSLFSYSFTQYCNLYSILCVKSNNIFTISTRYSSIHPFLSLIYNLQLVWYLTYQLTHSHLHPRTVNSPSTTSTQYKPNENENEVHTRSPPYYLRRGYQCPHSWGRQEEWRLHVGEFECRCSGDADELWEWCYSDIETFLPRYELGWVDGWGVGTLEAGKIGLIGGRGE